MNSPLDLPPTALRGAQSRHGDTGAPGLDGQPLCAAADDTRALLAYIGEVAGDLAAVAERSDLRTAAYFLNLARLDALIYAKSRAEPRSPCAALAPEPRFLGS